MAHRGETRIFSDLAPSPRRGDIVRCIADHGLHLWLQPIAPTGRNPQFAYHPVVRRRLMLILTLLLAGAIVNIAVAWGIGFIAARSSAWSSRRPGTTADRLARIGGSLVFQPKHEMRILVWTGGTYWDPLYEVGRPLPEWSNSFGRDPLSEFVADLQPGESLSSMEYAAGFPCWALRYCETIKHANGNSILLAQDGRVLRVPAWMYEMRLGADLPCWPIWPGFAINTVFYAALLWLAWIAPFALRRRVRIKRGLCVKCGYDLRGATSAVACPECGAAFPAKPQRGAPTTAQGNALGSDYATSPEP